MITAATALARKAEIYNTVLVEHGLPADFVAQLDSATAALKASLDARGEARAARVGATRGLESELAIGRRVVEIMDATLTRALRGNPSKMAEWRHVKRVTQSTRPPQQASQPTQRGVQGTSSAVQETSPAVQKAA